MKKTILTSASILALSVAAPAFGQASQSDVTQTGNENAATVMQNGNENISDIDQTGNDNTAVVNQRDLEPGIAGFTVPANNSDIDQFGNGGYAKVNQTTAEAGGPGNDAEIVQYSTEGTSPSPLGLNTPATIDNDGETNNAAIITQVASTAGGPNTASIRQGSAGAEVYGNLAEISQTGDNNESEITQDALGGGATNIQIGNSNTSTISQSDGTLLQSVGTAPDKVYDPEAYVTQSGNLNSSEVIQNANTNGGSRNLVADISQSGDMNTSTVEQNAMGPGFTGTYRAFVTQTGDSTSAIEQTGMGQGIRNFRAEVLSNDSTSNITQLGSGNNAGDLDATVTQSAGSTSTINQTVDAMSNGSPQAGYLTAEVNQAGGAASTIDQSANGRSSVDQTAIVNQNGASESFVTQTYNNEFSADFTATVDQTGDGHTSTVLQEDQGAANVAAGVGDSNIVADVDQSGEGNNSIVEQYNRGQFAKVMQTGLGETSTVIQNGLNNDAFVNQFGEGNNATVKQDGFGQMATVNQTEDATFGLAVINQNVPDTIAGPNGNGNNNATINQEKSADDRAFIDQVGFARGETATINQGVNSASSNSVASILQLGDESDDGGANLNTATINQDGGTGNNSFIVQTGAGNVATSTQLGSFNVSDILQNGLDNTATVSQTGNSHVSDVNQFGNNNTATVTQGF